MSIKNIHIISVGASIITNYNREKDNIKLPFIDDDAKFENILTDKNKFNKILKFVIKDPFKASAELNALKSFIKSKEIDEVHLVVTDTFVGKITSEIIKAVLKENSISVSEKIIPGYYKDKEKDESEAESKFIEGLSNLRDSLLNFIKEKKKNPENKIFINATGGFKPEILILMLVGSLTNSRVYYIHEFFKRIIFLPPVFLPFINNEISEALSEIASIPSRRISTEKDCSNFTNKYSKIYEDLKNYRLIEEKYGERDSKLFEIKLTDYGNLLSKLKE